jgi:hypothetical protein
MTYTPKGKAALSLLEGEHAKTTKAVEEALSEGNDAISFIINLAILQGMSDNQPTLHNAKAYLSSLYF